MHLSLRYMAVITVGMALLLGTFTTWVRAVVHTLPFPACWNCGAEKVRRSANHCLADAFLMALLLVPYRCRGCRVRFYGLRTHRTLADPNVN
ncbi:MAG TPA: hypothetical protein VGN17_06755 [Bryobacteraceae bacterium]|jgi:hypothetical protein